MSWFRRLEARLSAFAHEVVNDVEKIASEVVQAAKDVLHAGEAAIASVIRSAPEIALATLKDTYDQVIGNDLKTLRDPHATIEAKVEAAFDLATTITMPTAKIPAMIGEVALKNLIKEGESTAIVAAMKSLQASGDTPALVGVETALLDADPNVASALKSAGIDSAQATKTLAAIRDAVASGKDLPASAKEAVGELATALTKHGSLKDRVAALETAFTALKTAETDLSSLGTDAKSVGGALSPVTPATSATPAAPAVTQENGLTVVTTKETILALEDGTQITPDVVAQLKAEQSAHPGKKLYVVGKDLDAAATSELKAAGIGVAGAHQIAAALGAPTPATPAPEAPTAAHTIGDADLVRETLAKMSPETVQRIQRSGRAEVGMPHLEATPWDGKGQIGSVTSVIGARVEQYTGKSWTTYDAADLAPLQAQLAANAAAQDPTLVTKISPGDELRVGTNGSIDLISRNPQQPDLKAVHVDPGGQSRNVEPAALQRT